MIRKEIKFLFALWKANILAAMEYRAAFISQMLGMMLNNLVYFMFWVIFFDRFNTVQGWELSDMFLLFGIVATSFGLATFLFGNITTISDIIAGGRLDYYLSLPRPVLLHLISSRSIASGFGDFVYGLISFIVAEQYSIDAILRFLMGTTLSIIVIVSFMIIVHSLTFWIGNARLLAQQALNAMITFSLYPITLFDGTAKLLLFTVLPAAFIGAVPVEFLRSFSWSILGELLLVAVFLLSLSIFIFQKGLSRYESGSAIQTHL